MRRFAIFALALALGAPACDDDSPTGPSNSGAIVFTAELRASNEVPAISNAESNGQGTATIISGLTNDSAIRAAHIHNGAAGANANVFVDTRLTPANQIPTPGGAATINFEGVQITQTQAQAVLNNPAGHYFNMHSPLNPGGVIRGQLVRVR